MGCPVCVYMVEWQRRGLAALGLLEPAQEGGVGSELLQGEAPLRLGRVSDQGRQGDCQEGNGIRFPR